jgi:hypothetical protein
MTEGRFRTPPIAFDPLAAPSADIFADIGPRIMQEQAGQQQEQQQQVGGGSGPRADGSFPLDMAPRPGAAAQGPGGSSSSSSSAGEYLLVYCQPPPPPPPPNDAPVAAGDGTAAGVTSAGPWPPAESVRLLHQVRRLHRSTSSPIISNPALIMGLPCVYCFLPLQVPPGARHPVQFGREVLCRLLGLPDRLAWKACAAGVEAETAQAAAFRTAFAPFDFTADL